MTKIQRFTDMLAVSWYPPGPGQVLQSDDNVTGPWTTLSGVAASPYVTTAAGARNFYRVCQP